MVGRRDFLQLGREHLTHALYDCNRANMLPMTTGLFVVAGESPALRANMLKQNISSEALSSIWDKLCLKQLSISVAVDRIL
jgi:hypothetical protein